MAVLLDHITDEQADLIRSSHVFFVASADPALAEGPDGQGAVNLSPKGAADLHVIDRNTLAYFDYAGSGNETARHGMAGGPVTVMVTSFDEDAAIVRLYGRACAKPLEDSVLAAHAEELRAAEAPTPERRSSRSPSSARRPPAATACPSTNTGATVRRPSEAGATSSPGFDKSRLNGRGNSAFRRLG